MALTVEPFTYADQKDFADKDTIFTDLALSGTPEDKLMIKTEDAILSFRISGKQIFLVNFICRRHACISTALLEMLQALKAWAQRNHYQQIFGYYTCGYRRPASKAVIKALLLGGGFEGDYMFFNRHGAQTSRYGFDFYYNFSNH